MESRRTVSAYNNTVSFKDFYKSLIVFPHLSQMMWGHIILYSRGQTDYSRSSRSELFFFLPQQSGSPICLVQVGAELEKVGCCCSSLRRWEAGSPKAEILMEDDKFMWKTEAHPNRARALQSEMQLWQTGTWGDLQESVNSHRHMKTGKF